MAIRIEQLVYLGISLIIIGFLIIFFSTFIGAKDRGAKSRLAIVGFICPIPIGFGNDKNLLWLVMALSFVMLIIWFFFSFRMGR